MPSRPDPSVVGKPSVNAEGLRVANTELARLFDVTLRQLSLIETRASTLTASGALVAAVSLATHQNAWALVATVLFAASVGLGISAQWGRSVPMAAVGKVNVGLQDASEIDALASVNKQIADTTEALAELTRARSLMVRTGMVVQGAGILALVTGLAEELN